MEPRLNILLRQTTALTKKKKISPVRD